MSDQQQFFDARDLWNSQGTPYQEPDRVVPVIASVVRTLIHAAVLRLRFSLRADATVRRVPRNK